MAIANVSADPFAEKGSDFLAISALNTRCREEKEVIEILGSFVTALVCFALLFLRY